MSTVAEVEDWAVGLEEVLERIGPRFARSEPRARAGVYVRGLLSAAERKNGWTLAEQAGDRTPDAMQRLLNHADWDADAVRDDLRGYVVEHLGDERGGAGGRRDRVPEEGHQVGGGGPAVLRHRRADRELPDRGVPGLCRPGGRTLLDRELYLPKAWTEDRDRCAEAGIGPEVEFATKPELALAMLTRALDAGVPAGWVAGDEVYGQHSGLRLALEERGMPYVLAVPVKQHTIATPDGRIAPSARRRALGGRARAGLEPAVGRRRREGAAALRLGAGADPPLSEPGRYWLLVRRSITDGELAHYLCFCPPEASLADLVAVAGRRWAIEESFQTAKGEVGLDHYQVRRYDAWYRHITLAMLAHAFLTVTRAAASGEKGGSPTCAAS